MKNSRRNALRCGLILSAVTILAACQKGSSTSLQYPAGDNSSFTVPGLTCSGASTAWVDDQAEPAASTGDRTTFNIQFVPSRDAEKLGTLAKGLEPILKKGVGDKYTFNLGVGESYAACTEAMLSGSLQAGFLTASGLAQTIVENPGKINVLLTSVRSSYKVQSEDFPGLDDASVAKQVAAMNGEIDAKGNAVTDHSKGYVYRGEQSCIAAGNYVSILITCRDSYRASLGLGKLDTNGDGKIALTELLGKTVARQGATSGAGNLYPSFYLYNAGVKAGVTNGYTMADTLTDAKTQMKGVEVKGYDAALAQLMEGNVDAAWGFIDIRYANGYTKKGSGWYGNPGVFENTYISAMTAPIYNDTISVVSSLTAHDKWVIRHAFMYAVHDGAIATEGTGRYILNNVYSHTGYADKTNADYAGEVEMYKWKVAHASK